NDYSLVYRFNNGVPNQLWERATPLLQSEQVHHQMGVYAQDRWTTGRLTLNLGLRFDYFNYGFPQQDLGPGPLVPNRHVSFPEISSFVSFKDLSPRIGAVYDVFGDGKTAVKANVSRYVVAIGSALNNYSNFGNPTAQLSTIITRQWTDANRDYVPQCD